MFLLIRFVIIPLILVLLAYRFIKWWPQLKAEAGADLRTASEGTTSAINKIIAYFNQRPWEGIVFLILVALLFAH